MSRILSHSASMSHEDALEINWYSGPQSEALDQWYQLYLGTRERCKFSGPVSDQRNQKLRAGPSKLWFNEIPRDSDACELRSTVI